MSESPKKKSGTKSKEESSVTMETPEPSPEPTASLPTVELLQEPTDIVKVRVRIGSLRWEGGTYEKGEVFEVQRQRALMMGNSVEIL